MEEEGDDDDDDFVGSVDGERKINSSRNIASLISALLFSVLFIESFKFSNASARQSGVLVLVG